ncbi:hypothetical protein BIV57_10750 [Mangrovactinospora gilvigrisea]|uniref:Uncharacterized protein n=1 Tax=Mangrovactinospora gilvigrisea TaxID=1428644 RepID=A0A1J7BFF6_9ACTN|nr:hypothetical protein [Mangrovactinospora gilvigrisea]OIV37439.1 hypothetical protein BIV57_10750 [Mangrovactinospora gilvigrisea]
MICHYLFMHLVVPGFFTIAVLNARRHARRARSGTVEAPRSPQATQRYATLGCAGLGGLTAALFILAGLIPHAP